MMYKVRFEPDGIEVQVERGKTLLEAAVQAKVDISTSCGGKGTCKKCKVQAQGPVEVSSQRRIDPQLAADGYVLACQSYVSGDLVVRVPAEARTKGLQILQSHGEHGLRELSPMTLTKRVRLDRPTLADNLGDLERLARSLGMQGTLEVPLPLLQRLPLALREGGEVTAFLAAEDLGGGLVDLGQGDRNTGAALDIGTTTVVLSLIDLLSGRTLSTASDYNRQMRAGDDVISRIAYAEEGGLLELQGLIVGTINQLLEDAARRSSPRLEPSEVRAMAVAGNTTMVHLFLGLDPRTIRYEPYIPVTNVPPLARASDLGLAMAPAAPVYCLPGRASFVGGDITADVLSSGMRKAKELSLLIDVGTNGEVAVGNDELLLACSTSAGPAFEGGEVGAGMRAMPGAIEKVSISADMEPSFSVIGNVPAVGICGSGLIDLVAQMFLRGAIDKKGRIQLVDPKRTSRTEEGGAYVLQHGAGGLKEITITDADLANIMRTKAAVYAGCSVLLHTLGRSFADVAAVFIAGGFGNYIDVENAVTIGLLPDLPRERFRFIGNAALAGAVQALLSKERREEALRIHESMTYVELSSSQRFFDEFSSATFLPHTDAERFPSVARAKGL